MSTPYINEFDRMLDEYSNTTLVSILEEITLLSNTIIQTCMNRNVVISEVKLQDIEINAIRIRNLNHIIKYREYHQDIIETLEQK